MGVAKSQPMWTDAWKSKSNINKDDFVKVYSDIYRYENVPKKPKRFCWCLW